MQCQRLVEVGILHDIEYRREGFIEDWTNLSGHLDQRRLNIIRGGMWFHLKAVAAGYPSAKLPRLCKCFLHSVKGRLVNERTDKGGAVCERIADLHGGINLFQFRHEGIVRAVV